MNKRKINERFDAKSDKLCYGAMPRWRKRALLQGDLAHILAHPQHILRTSSKKVCRKFKIHLFVTKNIAFVTKNTVFVTKNTLRILDVLHPKLMPNVRTSFFPRLCVYSSYMHKREKRGKKGCATGCLRVNAIFKRMCEGCAKDVRGCAHILCTSFFIEFYGGGFFLRLFIHGWYYIEFK